MERKQAIAELLKLWESTQNKSSRWFPQDKADFLSNVSKLSDDDVEMKLDRFRALTSKSFERAVDRELSKLDKAGMFNVRNI